LNKISYVSPVPSSIQSSLTLILESEWKQRVAPAHPCIPDRQLYAWHYPLAVLSGAQCTYGFYRFRHSV